MKKKKFLAVVLCIVTTVVLFADVGMTAFAAERYITVDNIEYELDIDEAGEFYCVKSGRNASGDVVIPDEINGIPVTDILFNAFEKIIILLPSP